MQRNLSKLGLLYKAKPGMRKVIVCGASADFIDEIALNVLRGNIPLTEKQYAQLKKKRGIIRLVADKKVKHLKKKKTINQSGGFLLPLLGAAIPFITSLISRG